MNEKDEEKDDGYDPYPGASRATLAVLNRKYWLSMDVDKYRCCSFHNI